MSQKKKPRKDVRTTVSLAEVVFQMAEEMMVAKGFNDNFSAYVADLIRRDREKLEGKSHSSSSGGSRYPRGASEHGLAEEGGGGAMGQAG